MSKKRRRKIAHNPKPRKKARKKASRKKTATKKRRRSKKHMSAATRRRHIRAGIARSRRRHAPRRRHYSVSTSIPTLANPRRRRRSKVRANPHRRRHYRRNPGFGGLLKGDSVLGLGHTGGELASLVIGGLSYGVVSGLVAKHAGFILNPINSALGKAGPQVTAIVAPAVPSLLIGIPLHLLARKMKNKYALGFTRGLLAATVVGLGSSISKTLITAAPAATTKGLPQLRGYGGYDITLSGRGMGGKADFGSMPTDTVTSADFGGMGRYISAQEAGAMGGYDVKGDYSGMDDEEGLGSLG